MTVAGFRRGGHHGAVSRISCSRAKRIRTPNVWWKDRGFIGGWAAPAAEIILAGEFCGRKIRIISMKGFCCRFFANI